LSMRRAGIIAKWVGCAAAVAFLAAYVGVLVWAWTEIYQAHAETRKLRREADRQWEQYRENMRQFEIEMRKFNEELKKWERPEPKRVSGRSKQQ